MEDDDFLKKITQLADPKIKNKIISKPPPITPEESRQGRYEEQNKLLMERKSQERDRKRKIAENMRKKIYFEKQRENLEQVRGQKALEYADYARKKGIAMTSEEMSKESMRRIANKMKCKSEIQNLGNRIMAMIQESLDTDLGLE
jgi:hypothetical protein